MRSGSDRLLKSPAVGPGYSTNWPTSAASIAKILQANGYNTAAIGKWHLTPDTQQGPAGPFDCRKAWWKRLQNCARRSWGTLTARRS